MLRRRRVFSVALLLSALLTLHLAMLGAPTFAQTDPSPTPTDTSPSPTDTASPDPSPTDTASPDPSPTDTASPSPSDIASPSASPSGVLPTTSPSGGTTTTTKTATTSGSISTASRTVIRNLDAIIQGKATASFGGARTTAKLLAILGQLEKSGVPPVPLIQAAARPFPVAGLAYWVDDWHAYRCCPKPHLHQGLDLMAASGTPLLAVADGIVSNKVNDPSSAGLAVSISARDGTRYFYAHLSAYASGITVGHRVKMGEIIGYVGNTGNAAGGAMHLHFEIRPFGGPAVPPKPYVDKWLDEAEARALKIVQRITGKRVDVQKLDYSLWKNRLLELAQHELQAANALSARQAAAARAAKPKPPTPVDQQTLPYALPIVVLALLAGGLVLADRGRLPVGPARRRTGGLEDEDVPTLDAEAIERALALTLDIEAAFADTDAELDAPASTKEFVGVSESDLRP